ncbi:hypothetical protein BFP76_03290 [Amylibacter kogurei]|uniref:ABC transporter domain-containing protein n=1 Tax=Paramylibacter kogurei TaxID=1889778 RepID=A0A2G5K5W4_9RHOB|nr:ATP-binding cassette domain-containing protein [Amylibacter kogurei]PIB24260.1 hypothetical protein BFP76_03290 [Amylibacter kogurei]
MITGRNLSLAFGNTQVLRGANIDVPLGRLVAICGPNGAGKSTVLSVLAGEQKHYQGDVYFGDEALADLTSRDLSRRRAVLEQSPSLSANFCVDELVRLSIPMELPPRDTDVMVCNILDQLGLSEFAKRRVDNLSGGQRHRAHLARVLAQVYANQTLFGAGYLFLDEPTASLDILHQIAVMKIARAAAQNGVGVLVVLHDLNLAAAFADDVVMVNRGETVAAGPVGQVFASKLLSQIYETPINVDKHSSGRLVIYPELQDLAG